MIKSKMINIKSKKVKIMYLWLLCSRRPIYKNDCSGFSMKEGQKKEDQKELISCLKCKTIL